MREVNTVGQKSVVESKRDVKIESPCLNSPCSTNHSQASTRIPNPYHTVAACGRVPSYGRVTNYWTQGCNEYGRLGARDWPKLP